MAKVRKPARQRISELRQELKNLEAQEREREGKRDTRRKILLGETLLARAESEQGAARAECAAIVAALRARDRRVFEGWQPTAWNIAGLPLPSTGGDDGAC